jgi:hypothetical protein
MGPAGRHPGHIKHPGSWKGARRRVFRYQSKIKIFNFYF